MDLQPGRDEIRIPCSACGRSIWLAEVDGMQMPIVTRIIVGQLPNTTPVDLNAVRMPALVRQIMSLSLSRVNLCVPCLVELLELKWEPPTHGAGQPRV